MAAGSIIIDLLMRTGSFVTDTERAEKSMRALQKAAKESFDKAIVAGIVKGQLAFETLAGAARTTAQVFQTLTIDAAQFKDLEETTGAAAEALASLQVAASTAGVPIDAVGEAMNKLTKNLVGVDDESKAAGAALAALGLSVEEFKKLDPAAQYEEIGKALAGFADGASKTAVAQALLGKAGAEQLKVMKALEEQGGRTSILTKQQIDRADAFADAQARSAAQLRLYAQAAASEAIPALTTFTNLTVETIKAFIGVDAATGKLAAEQSIREWAKEGVIWVAELAGKLVLFAKGLGVAGAGLEILLKRGSTQLDDFNAKWKSFTEFDADAFANKLRNRLKYGPQEGPDQSEAERRRLGLPAVRLPELKFEGGAGKGKKEIDKAAQALNSLNREIQTFGAENDNLAKLLAFQDLKPTVAQLGQYKNALAELQQLRTADEIDKTVKGLYEERDALVLSKEQLLARTLAMKGATGQQVEFALGIQRQADAWRQQNELMEEGRRLTEDMRTPLEVLLARYEKLNQLLAANAINGDTYRRAVTDAQDNFAKATEVVEKSVEKVDDAARELGLTFSSAFEDAIVGGKGLREVLKGLEADIIRIVTRKLVTEPLANAISGFMGQQGGIGGIFSSLGGLFGFGGAKAGGGDVQSGRAYLVGEQGPEMFVPRTAGAIIPSHALADGAGATWQVSQTFVVPSAPDRRTQSQIAAAAARGLADASRRLN
jgi:hypothetical protein